MTPTDISHRIPRLLFWALESPEAVGEAALLGPASAWLDAALAEGHSDLLPMARTMAHRSMEWCVFATPDDYAELVRAFGAFNLAERIKNRLG